MTQERQQPLALRLADWIERFVGARHVDQVVSTELRRLHAENEALRAQIGMAPTDAEIDALMRSFYSSDEAAEMARDDDRRTARAILAQWGAHTATAAVAGPAAMQQLTTALQADPEYAWSWHCNLAMPIMDCTKVSHRTANLAAAHLMQHLFKIDTEQHPYFQVDDEAAPTTQPAPAAGLHPKTADLVQRFAAALTEKLSAAEKKYGYRDGWASPDWMGECRQQLVEHLAKGDPRDVAAYCAFLWHHGESTTATAAQADAQHIDSRYAPLLAVAERLLDAADYWSEYDVPIGIVEALKRAIDAAKGREREGKGGKGKT